MRNPEIYWYWDPIARTTKIGICVPDGWYRETKNPLFLRIRLWWQLQRLLWRALCGSGG